MCVCVCVCIVTINQIYKTKSLFIRALKPPLDTTTFTRNRHSSPKLQPCRPDLAWLLLVWIRAGVGEELCVKLAACPPIDGRRCFRFDFIVFSV